MNIVSCMPQALQVGSFSCSTSSLGSAIDYWRHWHSSDDITWLVLQNVIYRWLTARAYCQQAAPHQSDFKIIGSYSDEIRIDILVLANGQFRATFTFWQWIIHQTSHLLRVHFGKSCEKVLSESRGLCVYGKRIPKYTIFVQMMWVKWNYCISLA